LNEDRDPSLIEAYKNALTGQAAPIADISPVVAAVSWRMAAALAETPKEVVRRRNTELKSVAALSAAPQIAKMGLIAMDTPSPDALQRFLHAEIDRWGDIVRRAGMAGSE
jgi:tripartite-type tricarboxylate transporter receptor subunit TctC